MKKSWDNLFLGWMIGIVCCALIATMIWVPDPKGAIDQLSAAATQLPSYTAAVELPLDNDFYWSAKRLEAIAASQLGITITYTTEGLDEAAGMSNSQTRQIRIDASQHWTARFETLAHEIAHLMQPRFSTRAENEVWAETVGYLVAEHDGDHGALRRSSHYLVAFKDVLPSVLSNYRQELLRAAAFLE